MLTLLNKKMPELNSGIFLTNQFVLGIFAMTVFELLPASARTRVIAANLRFNTNGFLLDGRRWVVIFSFVAHIFRSLCDR